MVIAGRNVGNQWPQCVKGGFEAGFEFFINIVFHFVQWDVPGAFDHDLDVVFPGNFGEFAQSGEFCKLCLIVGIGNGAWPQAVS